MSRATDKRRRLRDGLAGDRAVVAVGAHDALTAKLIGSYGFDAVWVSGLGVANLYISFIEIWRLERFARR